MKSWFLAGSDPQDYELGIDANVVRNGKNSGYLKAKVAEPRGFGTLMQMFKADDYRNKRMRFSAVVKSAGIEEWAGLWMRIDGQKQGETLAFDNMQNRPIQGTTDWQKYEVCLDVPQESVCVAFGLLLAGKGQAWLSEVELEAVSAEVPTTSFEGYEGLPEKPGHHFLHLISIIGEIVPVLVAGFGGVLGALLAQSFHIPFWVSLLIAAAILLAIWAPGRFHARKTDYPGIIGTLITSLVVGVLSGLLLQSFHIPFWVSLLIAAAILLAIWAPGRFHARKTDYPAKPGNLDFAEDRA